MFLSLRYIWWRSVAWAMGQILYYFGNKTCGELDGSYYTGLSINTRRPCILAPGHRHICVTDWEWNTGLNRQVRFWFAVDESGMYSRAEIDKK